MVSNNKYAKRISKTYGGLNPCFSGRWSLTSHWMKNLSVCSLNPCFNGRWSLPLLMHVFIGPETSGLNPCFNGRWSLTARERIRLCISVLSIYFCAESVFSCQKKCTFFVANIKKKMSKNECFRERKRALSSALLCSSILR